LGVVKYHQINHNLFEDSRLHPETQKQLERLHYLIEHNLPIEKEMLYRLVPEVFQHEINRLQEEDKMLFEMEKNKYLRADGTVYEIDEFYNTQEFDIYENLELKQLRNMELYHHNQVFDMYCLYKGKPINDRCSLFR